MSELNFSDIKSFDDFRKLATNNSLSKYEKIGFPDQFRLNKEVQIFNDICKKLHNLNEENKVVLDIGPGCSEIPNLLINLSNKKNHTLALADCAEMLNLLPNLPFIKKFPGFFPNTSDEILNSVGKADVIICYSVFHYIFYETNYVDFVKTSIKLLKEGGQLLIGDIPNLDKRNRFFSSKNGIKFHQKYMNTKELPVISKNSKSLNMIDDRILDRIVILARSLGCDAYILPQPLELPMSNRRDDILIIKH